MSKSNETTPNVPTLRFDKLKDFHRQKLGALCTIVGGYAFDSKKMIPKGNYQIVKMGNFYAGKLDLSRTPTFLDNPTQSELSALLKKHDIVITLTGTVNKKDYGYTVQINNENNLLLNQRCALIRAKNNIDSNYLLYLLKSNEFLSQFYASSVGGTGNQTNVSIKAIEQFIVSIPHLDEQKRIGKFLSDIDKRISVQNKIISDLKVLKKELCNRYFKSVHNDTSLGYITLKDILTERKEYYSKDGTYTHGTLSKEGVSPKTERYDRDFLVKNEDKQYKVTHFNDICYNPANLKFGVICRNTYGDLIFSPIYVTFEIADTVYPAYIELFLTNANFIGRIRRYEQGTVYERMAVSSEDFLSYETRIPTYEEQVKFADKIQRIQDKIELETLFLNYLQKQRKYLLIAMFI